MLMFAKLSLMSFVYEMLETFYFPDEKVRKIYDEYLIEKVYMYHILTDTDSTSLQFLFISDSISDISEKKYREIIFEVIIASEFYHRFDTSHKSWDKFGLQKELLHKCLGCFSIENIDNPCLLTIACNPKENFELFQNSEINKKHKGIKKESSGMNFENYANRIVLLTNFDYFK